VTLWLALLACITITTDAFLSPPKNVRPSSSLHAIGALAKKAKEADLRQFVADGGLDDLKQYLPLLKEPLPDTPVTTLQDALTRRRGTLTVIAEYRRKSEFTVTGTIKDSYAAELLSTTFREAGVSAIAVLADERMGGCTVDDLSFFCADQRRAQYEVTGPVPVISSDLIVDTVQLLQAKHAGAAAVLVQANVVGNDALPEFVQNAAKLSLECIVGVYNNDQAQAAVAAGARLLLVHGQDLDEKLACIANVPETVCKIAYLYAKNDSGLSEIEDGWAVRDQGFQCAWIADALYKSGLETEHPAAIIRSLKSKSSLKWASPIASHGRGEGAKEYLGDIMM